MAIREQTGREISSPFENKIVAAGGIPAAKDSRAMITRRTCHNGRQTIMGICPHSGANWNGGSPQ